MRALSLEDPSAKATLASSAIIATVNSGWPGDSLRADHGFAGSYAAWPALTLEAFRLLDRPRRALEMLRSVESVLDEGPFGQSHCVATIDRPVRKAFKGGQDYFEGCGGAFAEVMLRWLLDEIRSPRGEATLEPERLQESGQCTLENLPGSLLNPRHDDPGAQAPTVTHRRQSS